MWWFFKPRCPVDRATRSWVDARMNWLASQFGLDRWWTGQAVEPTDEFFPDAYDCSEHAVEIMLLRICELMEVDADRIALRLYSEDQSVNFGNGLRTVPQRKKGSAGMYSNDNREVISIESSELADPTIVAATLAHELSHVRLLGENRLTGEEHDHEQLTDLATVFFGMGIFNANATVFYKQSVNHGFSEWKSGRLGYLSESTFGYALGLWTFVRGEDSPAWLRHLRPGVRKIVRQTVRYLAADAKNHWSHRRRKVNQRVNPDEES